MNLQTPLIIRLAGTNQAEGGTHPQRIQPRVPGGQGTWPRRPQMVARLAGRCGVSILVDKNTKGHRPGFHRPGRDLPLPADDRLRHPAGRRGHPGQGRPEAPGPAGFQPGRRGGRGHRGRRHLHLRAAALCRRLHHRGGRGRPEADRPASPRASPSSTWSRSNPISTPGAWSSSGPTAPA